MATKKQPVTATQVAALAAQVAQMSVEGKSQKQLAGQYSYLVGRLRMLARAGIQYHGLRDIYAVAGYPAQDVLDFSHYWAMYTRDPLGGRIVDMPAKSCWRQAPDIVEPDTPGDTAFTDAWYEMAERLNVWRYFERVDRLAGVGRYAVLMLGVRGVQDDQLIQPIKNMAGPQDLIYLGVYHELNARITTWITDTGTPRFGQPESYTLALSSGVSGFPKASSRVHASRIIHVAEDLLQDEVFGRPRLERCVNRLMDLDKITAGVGEGFWQAATRILQANIDPTADIQTPQLDDLETKMTEMIHDLRRQFMGQGVKLEWLPQQVQTPKDISDLYFELICAAAGIPRRILFGNEAGKLASTTDQASYFGMISERQEQYAEPVIVRQFIDRMVALGALPPPVKGPKAYEVVWPTLFELTETEEATANKDRALTAQALTPMGGSPLDIVEIDDDGSVWLLPRKPDELVMQPGGPGSPPPEGADRYVWQDGDLTPTSTPTGRTKGDGGSADGAPGGSAPQSGDGTTGGPPGGTAGNVDEYMVAGDDFVRQMAAAIGRDVEEEA